MPGYLDIIATALPAGHPWKNPTALLEGHTAFPYLTYFDTPDSRDKARHYFHQLPFGQASAMALGLTSYRCEVAPHHPRFCTDCAVDDRDQFGFAYFHREHQLPGVAVCWKHGCVLANGCRKCGRYPILGRPLTMAGSCNCDGGSVRSPVFLECPNGGNSLLWLARESARIVSRGATSITGIGEVRMLLKRLAVQRGFGRGALLLHVSMGAAIEARFGRTVLEWLGYPAWKDGDASPWVRRSLGHTARRLPVITQLLFVGVVSESVAAFESASAYSEAAMDGKCNSKVSVTDSTGEILDWRFRLRHALEECGYRISTAARAFGISSWTLASEAKRQSIRIPLSLRAAERAGERITEIREALQEGEDKKDIAAKYSINEWTLLLLELDDPSLAETWTSQRASKVRAAHRSCILKALLRNPLISRRLIAKEYAGTYDFVLANDRDWFSAQFPIRAAAKRGNRRSASVWPDRDMVAAAAIRSLAESIKSSSQKPIRLTKFGLLRSVQLASKYTGSADRFPMTVAVLDEVVESKEQFLRRKIVWAITELKQREQPISTNVLRRVAGVSGRTLTDRQEYVKQKARELGAAIAAQSTFS
jgi:hypothetical protein